MYTPCSMCGPSMVSLGCMVRETCLHKNLALLSPELIKKLHIFISYLHEISLVTSKMVPSIAREITHVNKDIKMCNFLINSGDNNAKFL